MILTVTPNPSVDHVLYLEGLALHDTNRARRIERDAGGKGVNISRAIHGLGGKTLATGFLGGGAGAYVRHVLNSEGVPNEFVPIRDETRVDFSVELEDGHPPTCFNEPGPTIYDSEVETLVDKITALLPKARWLVLGGSHPPGTPAELFLRIGQLARNAGIPFALDADNAVLQYGIQAGPTLLKPNASEASRLLKRKLQTEEDCLEAAQEISKQIENQNHHESAIVVISRGEHGAVMSAKGQLYIGRTPKVERQGTVGCGDSMLGAMITLLDNGCSPAEAFRFGLAAGAATAQKKGPGIANLEDLDALLPEAKVRAIS